MFLVEIRGDYSFDMVVKADTEKEAKEKAFNYLKSEEKKAERDLVRIYASHLVFDENGVARV